MPDKKDKKREAPISYRPPSKLRDEFQSRVEKSGMSTSAFITKSVFNQAPPRQSRRPSIEKKLLMKLLNEAVKIHSDLQQIEMQGNGDSQQLETANEALNEIRAALLKAAERYP